jgi:hypothetical protein
MFFSIIEPIGCLAVEVSVPQFEIFVLLGESSELVL